ncbi:Sec7 domain-containing protein [Mucor mucedo]|uniref:Sec7 domain-containing protein n=1 Tax=Mucor mucedo TaxID=29922 RepID=UPI00221EBC51|nr:Sec7 domain-containing protein [Mucor mucedo]KAI7889892.1 Sec7 domain-containing protein [Mucor mucedo]
MSTSSPVRSHSLVHHQQHTQWIQSQQLKLQPSLSVSTTPHRSTSVNHSARLVRSSSLSQHSKKTPTRSKSLPQKPIKPTPTGPFGFLQHEPPPLPKHSVLVKSLPRRTSSLKKPKQIKTDEEVTKSLLEWKHKSVFKVDWATLFSPSVTLWNENNIFGSVEDLFNYSHGQENVLQAAQSLWIQDQNFVPKKEMASYLGKLDPFRHLVLKSYIDYFDFNGLSLDQAFRKLCSKLYFKAEAQEIDRILEVFSHKYYNSSNSQHMYQSADVVYTITYSIMLLNTDLHLVQISSHAKMSSALFCENTMSTVLEQAISLKGDELSLWQDELKTSLKVSSFFFFFCQLNSHPSYFNMNRKFMHQ